MLAQSNNNAAFTCLPANCHNHQLAKVDCYVSSHRLQLHATAQSLTAGDCFSTVYLGAPSLAPAQMHSVGSMYGASALGFL